MFTINKSHEQRIKQVLKSASAKGNIQAYGCAYIEAKDGNLKIISGDGTIELSTVIADAQITSEGTVCVDATKLSQAISACKFECKVLFKDGFIDVKGAKSKFKLMTVSAESYPSYLEPEAETKLDVNTEELISKLKKAAIIAPTDDVRYYLNGINIKKHIAATDGHRLVILPCDLDVDVIIPTGSVKSIPDGLNGDVYISSNMITINGADVTFKTKVIDGKFPDINRVMQNPTKHIGVDIESLREAVKAATITQNKTTNTIKIVFGDQCTVGATGGNNEQSIVGFDADIADPFEFAVNSKYLLDALQYYSGSIQVGFTDNQIVIDAGGVKNIVMRVRA
jgi:DNA polymerase-3 subunit beta